MISAWEDSRAGIVTRQYLEMGRYLARVPELCEKKAARDLEVFINKCGEMWAGRIMYLRTLWYDELGGSHLVVNERGRRLGGMTRAFLCDLGYRQE